MKALRDGGGNDLPVDRGPQRGGEAVVALADVRVDDVVDATGSEEHVRRHFIAPLVLTFKDPQSRSDGVQCAIAPSTVGKRRHDPHSSPPAFVLSQNGYGQTLTPVFCWSSDHQAAGALSKSTRR